MRGKRVVEALADELAEVYEKHLNDGLKNNIIGADDFIIATNAAFISFRLCRICGL